MALIYATAVDELLQDVQQMDVHNYERVVVVSARWSASRRLTQAGCDKLRQAGRVDVQGSRRRRRSRRSTSCRRPIAVRKDASRSVVNAPAAAADARARELVRRPTLSTRRAD